MSIKRDLKRAAFQLILEAGEEGFLQVEMWRRLGIMSKEGSNIAHGLEERGGIKRQRELHDGRWTYRLFSVKKPATVNSIMDCPCISCEDLEKCTPGHFVSPLLCKKLTYWIDPNTDTELASPDELYEDGI